MCQPIKGQLKAIFLFQHRGVEKAAQMGGEGDIERPAAAFHWLWCGLHPLKRAYALLYLCRREEDSIKWESEEVKKRAQEIEEKGRRTECKKKRKEIERGIVAQYYRGGGHL